MLPPKGFLWAAVDEDLTAMRAIADWFREREDEDPRNAEIARSFVLLAYVTEIRHVKARLVREMVPQLPPPPVVFSIGRLRRFFRAEGFPARVSRDTTYPVDPDVGHCDAMITLPADGIDEDKTRAAMLTLLRQSLPGVTFRVVFEDLLWGRNPGTAGACNVLVHGLP